MNRRFLLALAASALFGLVAIMIFRNILQRQVDDVKNRNPNQIVHATTKIPAGTTIAANQVRLAPYATVPLPEGSFSLPADVIGKIAQVELDANLPIQAKNIATLDKVGPGNRLKEGSRAMAIRVDEASSVAGFTTPGSIVDVVAVVTPSANSKPVSKVIVQNLRVLANGTNTQARTEAQGRVGNTVTLEVTPAQAEILTLAMREGTLHLLLRHPADEEYVNVPPVVMTGVVDEYKTDSRNTTPATNTTAIPTNYPGWFTPPPPKSSPTPTATPSPAMRMAQVRVISGDKVDTVQVRQ
ncbi:MAG: Flp pilus assembly protein CpaB [Acidobacteria bacterium]|nr:Flp pilus assembly protein CpaB [Acidobacteriota bacterium]